MLLYSRLSTSAYLPSPFKRTSSANKSAASMLVFFFVYLSVLTFSNASDTSSSRNHGSLPSKRIFLSPRDLQGVYSRFLEISENSTLCPNTIAHRTSGVLYPTGNIHLPLNNVFHDGTPCLGGGELIVRFRRRMQSKEIENEFNITSNATGIDKMVRDILLALEGFYFGRQSSERKCRSSVFPSEMAFFFTSEARPFAANVGVPFRRSPKIMFVVDKTRVCAFSSSLTGSKTIEMIKNPSQTANPDKSNTPPVFKQSVQPSTSPSAVPKQRQEEPVQSEESKTNNLEQNSANSYPKSTPAPSKAPVISDSSSEEKKMPPYKKKPEKQNEVVTSTTPSAVSKPQPVSNATISSPIQTKEKNKEEKQSGNKAEPSPSPTQAHPINISENSTNAKNSKNKKALLPVKPSRSPMPSPSVNPLISITSSTSSQETGNNAVILSAPPHTSPHASSHTTGNASKLHSNGSLLNTEYMFPSPSPALVSLGSSNMSDSHSNVDLNVSTPMTNSTEAPTEVEPEVILGDSGSTCFPSFATVTLRSGGTKRMDELSVGEFVFVGRGISSRVIDFSHYDHTVPAVFLRFRTDTGRKLTVTPSHFVYTDKKLMPAIDVAVGDRLLESDGNYSLVLKISTVHAQGLFNPHTLHGDVVVDGFIVSTYTLAAIPSVAHSLLAPIRFLHQLGFRFTLLLKISQHQTMLDAFKWAFSSTTHSVRSSL